LLALLLRLLHFPPLYHCPAAGLLAAGVSSSTQLAAVLQLQQREQQHPAAAQQPAAR
jgi:hypothetical protein